MTYEIDIAGLKRDLPLCKVTDDLYIGAFVMFGDVELTIHCAKELLKRAPEYDYMLAPEAKSIPLIYEMARQTGAKKYFIARKKAKAYMDAGNLVPDELTVDLVIDRVAQPDCEKGYILDGFPRTIPQAEVFTKQLAGSGDKIDFAIDVEVPDENIINRMGGRRSCPNCGATYHIQYIPPKKEGICDVCGTELVLRNDDKPETVKNRLNVYHEATQPLIDFYKAQGCLKAVDGTQDMKDVFAAIVKILED